MRGIDRTAGMVLFITQCQFSVEADIYLTPYLQLLGGKESPLKCCRAVHVPSPIQSQSRHMEFPCPTIPGLTFPLACGVAVQLRA